MKALILAGGSGTRLWPLSRKSFPKQFLKLNGNKSLLHQTAERLQGAVQPEDITIITNSNYKFHVKADMELLLGSRSHIILEPEGKNTAPAIALGVKYCIEKLGCSEDEVVFVCPSDHVIRPVEKFAAYIKQAECLAREGHIVTFGIVPTKPETGYGYIKAVEKAGERVFFEVERFVEKPDRETAARYIAEGCYYWNSGMFAFSIGTILSEFRSHMPEINGLLEMNYEELLRHFAEMPDISIDYAVLEKSRKVATMPLDVYWNDIGSWDSLCEVLENNEKGNVKIGDVIAVDTKDTLILGNKRLISTIGLEDILIIETDDAILISKKGEAQKVRDVVNTLKEMGRKEVEEHVTTYRPWGSYTILEDGPRYKIKRIVVNPCERLSLQMHYHRSEHWVVVKGTARVTIADKEVFIHENESAYVPKSTLHRLENPGKVPLEIIEVQNGEYVGEDDIVRLEDIYGREA